MDTRVYGQFWMRGNLLNGHPPRMAVRGGGATAEINTAVPAGLQPVLSRFACMELAWDYAAVWVQVECLGECLLLFYYYFIIHVIRARTITIVSFPRNKYRIIITPIIIQHMRTPPNVVLLNQNLTKIRAIIA